MVEVVEWILTLERCAAAVEGDEALENDHHAIEEESDDSHYETHA